MDLSYFALSRDIIGAVRPHTAHQQLREQVGGCLQGEANQVGGQGCCPCQGTSKGKHLRCSDVLSPFLLHFVAFMFPCVS